MDEVEQAKARYEKRIAEITARTEAEAIANDAEPQSCDWCGGEFYVMHSCEAIKDAHDRWHAAVKEAEPEERMRLIDQGWRGWEKKDE